MRPQVLCAMQSAAGWFNPKGHSPGPWPAADRMIVGNHDRISSLDLSSEISGLAARAAVKLPQLLQGFHAALFRCCSQQDPGLLTIPGDAVALQVKLGELNFCRTVACF
jgi:hypothetical protein